MRNRIRKLIHNAMWVPFGSRSGYFIGCARFCFLSGSDQVSLNVYFNAAPLLSPKTGIGQYCLNLMSELENFSDVEPHYFYGGAWSDQLLRQAPTSVTHDDQKVKRAVAQSDSRSRVRDSAALARTTASRRALLPPTSAVYHEPNFLSFRTPLPTVVTIHDLSILRYPETHPRDRVAFMTRRIGESIRRADCVISDSEYGRQEILAEFNLPPEKVVSVLLAAGSGFSPVASGSIAGACWHRSACTAQQYILSVGTLEPRKNLTTAIKAYARLPEAIRQEIPFVIAGMKGLANGWAGQGGGRADRQRADPPFGLCAGRGFAGTLFGGSWCLFIRRFTRGLACRHSRPWPAARR